jgi:hypothetical protein
LFAVIFPVLLLLSIVLKCYSIYVKSNVIDLEIGVCKIRIDKLNDVTIV